jgi:hypothetical protein
MVFRLAGLHWRLKRSAGLFCSTGQVLSGGLDRTSGQSSGSVSTFFEAWMRSAGRPFQPGLHLRMHERREQIIRADRPSFIGAWMRSAGRPFQPGLHLRMHERREQIARADRPSFIGSVVRPLDSPLVSPMVSGTFDRERETARLDPKSAWLFSERQSRLLDRA